MNKLGSLLVAASIMMASCQGGANQSAEATSLVETLISANITILRATSAAGTQTMLAYERAQFTHTSSHSPTFTNSPTASHTSTPIPPTITATPRPTATPLPPPTSAPPSIGSNSNNNCHPSYIGACLEMNKGDWDCAKGSGNGPNYVQGPIRVQGSDPYQLDRDKDGIACE